MASGLNGDAKFPGGTLRMQAPHFRALGLNLERFHFGTLNVSIAPRRFRVLDAALTLRAVKWHPTKPAEDFSFLDVPLLRRDAPAVDGLVYYPHPETKPAHFRAPDVLELLLPFVPRLDYGMEIRSEAPDAQVRLMRG